MTQADTDIHALAFFTADHAAVENGKAYVNGGFWDRLQFPAFPAASSFAVVAVLHVPWHAYHQQHTFAIHIEDADGGRLPADFAGQFQVGTAPDMKVGQPTIMPISALISGMPIERPGDYSFVLSVDGGEIARWTIHAVQVGSPPLPGARPGPSSIPGMPA